MIPIYTENIRKAIIDEYLSFNLIALLINDPSLGLSDSPTVTELEARRNLTMTYVASKEIGAANLKGYKRFIITPVTVTNVYSTRLSEADIKVTFTPSEGNSYDPATHIVYVRGANLLGATDLNGNNRGDTQGTVISIEPLTGAPLTLTYPAIFAHNTFIRVNSNPV